MNDKLCIQAFASLKNGRVMLDGKEISKTKLTNFGDWMDELYKTMEMSYPKFHKMDNLSKLGFVTSEYLLKDKSKISNISNDKIAIVLSNRSSSLDTDYKYNKLLEKGVASPAVFVYTLPNILIGELCIRNNIKGESVFFVSENFDISQQVSYVDLMLQSEIADACIGGWVELMNDSYESFLYLVTKEKSEKGERFTKELINRLYNQI